MSAAQIVFAVLAVASAVTGIVLFATSARSAHDALVWQGSTWRYFRRRAARLTVALFLMLMAFGLMTLVREPSATLTGVGSFVAAAVALSVVLAVVLAGLTAPYWFLLRWIWRQPGSDHRAREILERLPWWVRRPNR